jgi:hypothetical protein
MLWNLHNRQVLVGLHLLLRDWPNHHHWLDSPTWALAFLRSFCQLRYPAIASSDFVTRVYSRMGLSAHAQPPAILEGQTKHCRAHTIQLYRSMWTQTYKVFVKYRQKKRMAAFWDTARCSFVAVHLTMEAVCTSERVEGVVRGLEGTHPTDRCILTKLE